VATVVADASKWQPPAKVGAILLDAPCSATGTIRRHPDIPWLKSEQDVEKLADLQDRLLDNAASMLAPGGTLVYCTCSLEAAEGQERLETFLTGRGDLERVPVKPEEVGGLSQLITEKGELRTRPDHLPEFGGLDGFYACRLRKRGLS
jgi:16S rRNA (cytosine967-C5)-methyltransferase